MDAASLRREMAGFLVERAEAAVIAVYGEENRLRTANADLAAKLSLEPLV